MPIVRIGIPIHGLICSFLLKILSHSDDSSKVRTCAELSWPRRSTHVVRSVSKQVVSDFSVKPLHILRIVVWIVALAVSASWAICASALTTCAQASLNVSPWRDALIVQLSRTFPGWVLHQRARTIAAQFGGDKVTTIRLNMHCCFSRRYHRSSVIPTFCEHDGV